MSLGQISLHFSGNSIVPFNSKITFSYGTLSWIISWIISFVQYPLTKGNLSVVEQSCFYWLVSMMENVHHNEPLEISEIGCKKGPITAFGLVVSLGKVKESGFYSRLDAVGKWRSFFGVS